MPLKKIKRESMWVSTCFSTSLKFLHKWRTATGSHWSHWQPLEEAPIRPFSESRIELIILRDRLTLFGQEANDVIVPVLL